jgi:hypothetical protein
MSKGNAYKDAVVLDIGCGKEMPLAKLLYVNKFTPVYYVGVDANKMDVPEMLVGKKIPIRLWAETDFTALEYMDVSLDGRKGDSPCHYAPNVVVCLEVLEHMLPEHCRRTLQHMLKLSAVSCDYFISTPCFNGSAAGNHISEMTFGALGALIEDLGFEIVGVWGTFASIRDYKHELSAWTHYYKEDPAGTVATTDLMPLFEVLSEYYCSNILATIFAPLFPQYARNCLWHLKRVTPNYKRRFAPLADMPEPWGQHPSYRDLNG